MSDKGDQHKAAGKRKPRVLLLFDVSRAYGRDLFRGIAKYCEIHQTWQTHLLYHWEVQLHQFSESPGLPQLLKYWKCDAVIVDDPALIYREPLLQGMPCLYTIRPPGAGSQTYYLDGDHFAMGSMAAEFFINKGFTSYAFYGYTESSWSEQRREGYLDTLKTKGFTASVYESSINWVSSHGDEELANIAHWLRKLTQPVAVFTCNDLKARYILDACSFNNLEIPEQVSVLGVDNDQILCKLFNPPLSSIAINAQRAGYEAAELLEKLIAKQKVQKKVIYVSPEYVAERQSTNILQVDDPDVRRALRYIREHCSQILRIADILEHVGVSRRMLELKFNKILGRTIKDEVRRCHLQYITKVLIETNTPVLEIARSIGYTSENNISRLFREAMGCTPREYRKKYGQK